MLSGYRGTSGPLSPSPPNSEDAEKTHYAYDQYHVDAAAAVGAGVTELSDPTDVNHSLHRGLSARQVSMIAIVRHHHLCLGSRPARGVTQLMVI